MGCCSSNDPDSAKNQQIDKLYLKDKKKDEQVNKILFLGSGGSGKSTIFKQLRAIYGNGYNEEDRKTFIDHIHAQIIEQMKLALECAEYPEDDDDNDNDNDDDNDNEENKVETWAQLSSHAKGEINIVMGVKDPKLTEEVGGACKTLWLQQCIKQIYAKRAVLKIEDSSAYFWDRIDEIKADEYLPNDDDILLVRYRTTGVIDQKFEHKKHTFHIFDVGGQKSERKKWIHCFEKVTAVLFAVPLSDYDSGMFEDEYVNMMDDAIELWDKIVNNEWFNVTKIFLLFNKTDLFAKKIKHKSLKGCGQYTEAYDEDICYNDCKDDETELFNQNLKYIKDRFMERIGAEKKNDVYALEVCAVDKDIVEDRFDQICDIVIGEKKEEGDLLKITVHRQNTISPVDFKVESTVTPNKGKVETVKISKGEKALRMVGKLVYYMVMLVYGLHIILLYPILYLCYKTKLKNSSFLFESIPIEDSLNATSILLTTIIVLLIVNLLEVHSEIQSWMIAYIIWCLYVVIYLYNRACTVYVIFSDREIFGMKAGNVKVFNLIIKYVVGVEVENQAENNYTRLLAVVGGLFPALLAGFIANYILNEQYTLKCSKDFVGGICDPDAGICCKLVSSHQFDYFYEFMGRVASRIIASFGIVRIIGWLFCKGHPELKDIAKKMKKNG